MKAAGLEARTGLVEDESLMTAEWISDLVFNRNKADAIVCMNGVCTILTLRGMHQLGKQLSHDVAFLSFDDFELADMMIPSVSVLRQPSGAFGYEAAKLIFERIRGEFSGEKRSLIFSTTLILRESCGCKPLV